MENILQKTIITIAMCTSLCQDVSAQVLDILKIKPPKPNISNNIRNFTTDKFDKTANYCFYLSDKGLEGGGLSNFDKLKNEMKSLNESLSNFTKSEVDKKISSILNEIESLKSDLSSDQYIILNNGIGFLYTQNNNFIKAKEVFEKVLDIDIDKKNTSLIYNLIFPNYIDLIKSMILSSSTDFVKILTNFVKYIEKYNGKELSGYDKIRYENNLMNIAIALKDNGSFECEISDSSLKLPFGDGVEVEFFHGDISIYPNNQIDTLVQNQENKNLCSNILKQEKIENIDTILDKIQNGEKLEDFEENLIYSVSIKYNNIDYLTRETDRKVAVKLAEKSVFLSLYFFDEVFLESVLVLLENGYKISDRVLKKVFEEIDLGDNLVLQEKILSIFLFKLQNGEIQIEDSQKEEIINILINKLKLTLLDGDSETYIQILIDKIRSGKLGSQEDLQEEIVELYKILEKINENLKTKNKTILYISILLLLLFVTVGFSYKKNKTLKESFENSGAASCHIHFGFNSFIGKLGNLFKKSYQFGDIIWMSEEFEKLQEKIHGKNWKSKVKNIFGYNTNDKKVSVKIDGNKLSEEITVQKIIEKMKKKYKNSKSKVEAEYTQNFETRNGKVYIKTLLTINKGKLYMRVEDNTELEQKNEELNIKGKEINDSLESARRIQKSIVSGEKDLKKLFSQSFYLNIPHSTVSGDFLWIKEDESGKIWIALSDCTGHGVPGAFLSILGFNKLNEIKLKDKNTGSFLDELKRIFELSLNDGKSSDGMDLSLICYDPKTLNMEFSGTKRDLYIIKKGEIDKKIGERKVIEFNGDKKFIGDEYNLSIDGPFTKESLQLEIGDMIYMFSDGYIDQFGGKNNKKFLKKNFKELLASISHLTPEEQKQKLEQTLKEWKGENEQVDDITVVGIKI